MSQTIEEFNGSHNEFDKKDQINQAIYQFVNKAIELELITDFDRHYITNRLLAILNLDDISEIEVPTKGEEEGGSSLLDLMDIMVAYAKDRGIIDATQSDTEIMEARIMDLLTPSPTEINQHFWKLYESAPSQATDYFYDLSQKNDYIKTRNIARNIIFSGQSDYGELEITINLSKPEKDPKEIAKALEQKSVNYPKCALCMENEGYKGHVNHAARQNHRIIRLNLEEENYGFQYSPYVYYNEHSIFLNEHHIPMVIDSKCFNNLLEIVGIFPHYFVGSNADLPRVGGSILTHDHYQGGRHSFPMEKAESFQSVELKRFKKIEADLVHWPMSVIRLRSQSRAELVEAATFILDQWIDYSDESLDIVAHTTERHNTITPIARHKDGAFELDLVLRNNRVSEAHPDGIFHPHQDVHHIKKENIGLIEVMGLAVLPPRLVGELETVTDFLLGRKSIEDVTPIHQDWALAIQSAESEAGLTEENVEGILQAHITKKFARVLEDAGVFKQTDQGRLGFMRFIESLNK